MILKLNGRDACRDIHPRKLLGSQIKYLLPKQKQEGSYISIQNKNRHFISPLQQIQIGTIQFDGHEARASSTPLCSQSMPKLCGQ